MIVKGLTPKIIASPLKQGKYLDGGGLFLRVANRGMKSWCFRYKLHGKFHTLGLGSARLMNVDEARIEAQRIQRLVMRGIDPKQEKKPALFSQTKDKTFRECTDEFIACHSRGWKCNKNTLSWEPSLRTYAYPYFGEVFVREINTQHILQALQPIWLEQPIIAVRVRKRIARVLAWATITGYREGDNPARWEGHLKKLLPSSDKIKRVQHHPSMPYQQIASFLKTLAIHKTVKIYSALIFTILTACCRKEVIYAKWEEIDFENAIWNIPKERMKSGRSHRVPLTTAMLNILYEQKGLDPIWVFPGTKLGKPFSSAVICCAVSRLTLYGTVYGFRATFQAWAEEQAYHPREVVELALARTISAAARAAYPRGELFRRYRELMQEWSEWCFPSTKIDD